MLLIVSGWVWAAIERRVWGGGERVAGGVELSGRGYVGVEGSRVGGAALPTTRELINGSHFAAPFIVVISLFQCTFATFDSSVMLWIPLYLLNKRFRH